MPLDGEWEPATGGLAAGALSRSRKGEEEETGEGNRGMGGGVGVVDVVVFEIS